MWLGLDVGTSSVKAVLLGDDGQVIGRGSAALQTDRRAPGHAEQDPTEYVRAAAAATHQALSGQYGPRVRLDGIGLSGQTPTLVAADDQARPVRAALTWQDSRAGPQAEALAGELGDPVPLVGTSLPWTPSANPAKMRWLAEHEPSTVERTRWLLQPKDYLGFVLTGSPLSDPWSSKGLCDVRTAAPAERVVHATGWPTSVVPPLAAPWQSRGGLTSSGAAALGLNVAGVPVSVGCSDAMAGMLALGVLTTPSSFVLTGTSSMAGTSVRAGPAQAHPLYVVPPTCAPLTVVYGPTQSSGAAVEWVARLLGRTPDEVVDLAGSARPGRLPVFVPYLSGERAPVWRSDVRAVLAAIGADVGAPELAAAVLHGVASADRHVLQTAAELVGEPLREVRLGGHAGQDRRWWPVRSRTLGVDLVAVDDADPPSRGAAMLAAAAAAGAAADGGDQLHRVAARMAAPTHRIVASAGDAATARSSYAQYVRWVEHALSSTGVNIQHLGHTDDTDP